VKKSKRQESERTRGKRGAPAPRGAASPQHKYWPPLQQASVLTDLYIYILDVIPAVQVVSNHVDNDKLTTANGRTFTQSSDDLSSQSR